MRSITALLCLTAATAALAQAPASQPASHPTLAVAQAALKVPPEWVEGLQTDWDAAKPWQETRLHVRRLFSQAATEPEKAREAVKLTYLHAKKGDIGDGSEYPMYLFMGGQYAWAIQEFQARFKAGKKGGYEPCAACYAYFGEYDKAIETLQAGLRNLPEGNWKIAAQASLEEHLGDAFSLKGDRAKAKEHLELAAGLYPTSAQDFDKEMLPRKVARVKAKIALLEDVDLAKAKLKDGTYKAAMPGYSGKQEVEVTVVVKDGKLADLKVDHDENIEFGATTIVPKRILQAQSLKVDTVTGATVSSQAVITATYEALRQAGLGPAKSEEGRANSE